jgi:hypothetical protein
VVSDERLSQWLRRQPKFVAGDVMAERLLRPTAADFNGLVEDLNKANLGLATTRELLAELQVRGQVGALERRGEPIDYGHDRLDRAASRLLATVPAEVLDYRTVDNG